MPPGRGVGLRPTADTGVPLVDAYLWTDPPGISEASCDIAGGARAWDYSRYNPWQLSGDAQNHFDPLWGMVLPALGAWFPENALDLARNANPPLDGAAPAATAATEIAGAGPQPLPATASAGRPVGRPAGRPMGLPMGRPMGLPVGRPMGRLARAGGGDAVPLVGDAPAGAGANSHPEAHRALAPAFDSANPYR
jgi:cellulase/cellobiase CelA1